MRKIIFVSMLVFLISQSSFSMGMITIQGEVSDLDPNWATLKTGTGQPLKIFRDRFRNPASLKPGQKASVQLSSRALAQAIARAKVESPKRKK